MKKILAITILVFSMISCKTKQAVLAEGSAGEQKAVKEIIDGHYKNTKDFKTLLIKGSVDYEDSKTKQSVSVEIKIKKDEIILVSVRALGFNVAKAIITPEKVSYYERINGNYFEGSYAVLSKWLGTELDFNKVQNMLTGEALFDLTKGKYAASLVNGQHKLESLDKSSIAKQFFFESTYLLKKELITQAGQQPRSLQIEYPAHREYPQAVLPATIKIEAEQKNRVNITIDYNTVTFDENLTFPYEVPEGFDQIFID